MSKNQARLLRFLIRYPGWNTIGQDCRATVRTLSTHGLIDWNEETKQARIIRRTSEEA